MSFGNTIGNFFTAILTGLQNFRWSDAVDIVFMTLAVFWLILFFKRMGASQLLRGLLTVFLVLYLASNLFELTMINWLFDKILISGIVCIVVLFQPELRRAFDHLGRQKITSGDNKKEYEPLINALKNLSKRSVGALVVIENTDSLNDVVETGVKIDALQSAELIENIFEDKTPLHDGAVIIRDGRIAAASCIIGLVSNLPNVPQQFGTRHRAAVSVTIDSDCLALIVSEETGRISYAKDGILHTGIDNVQLVTLLEGLSNDNPIISNNSFFKKFFRKKEDK